MSAFATGCEGKGNSGSSLIFNIHSLEALNSWWSLKVRRKADCLGFVWSFPYWSLDGDEGARVIFYASFVKECVFKKSLCITLQSYNHGLPKRIRHVSMEITLHQSSSW